MINGYFDMQAFLTALDQVRATRNLTWYRVWHETGIQCQSLKNMGTKPKGMSVHTLATLAAWSDLDVRQFMKYQEVQL